MEIGVNGNALDGHDLSSYFPSENEQFKKIVRNCTQRPL